ncbi:MAG: MBOAT family protein [Oscillospiraceae bacterium]|nr:MBOAT family protein [Oscillospiraceae bacterium]
MIFNSFAYFVFFPIVLLGHFLLPHRFRWVFLLLASYYFYISWNLDLLYLILLTTSISYASALIIEKTESKKTKKIFLAATLVSCFGVLFFFKYFNFLSAAVLGAMSAFGLKVPEFSLDVLLPVGISFYTFQTLSYVIDVYRGNIKAERHFGYYALFVSFFPQLVAGPIERPENLLPQIKATHRPDPANFSEGLRIAIRGFVKKIVVADMSARFVNQIYNNPTQANAPAIIVATILFAFQIYGDFSGYTDIATGCARMMGIKLMKNFDLPYSSKSIKEFWARWHISLSSWFKDYLYIPLGGNRVSVPRYLTNVFIVFLVSGLWHGAEWTFVIWGALHGIYQITGYLTRNIRENIHSKIKIYKNERFASAWQTGFTFVLVCFAWIFFRANNVSELGELLGRLVFSWPAPGQIFASLNNIGFGITQLAITALSLYLMRILDRSPELLSGSGEGGRVAGIFSANRYVLSVWIVAFAWLVLLAGGGASSFIYFQF